MDISPKNSSNLIERLLTYKGTEATPYVERFNKAWIINAIDELNVMKCLEAQFKNYDAQGCDVIDFTKAMLNIISHEEDETLYITIGLIDLHKEICETFGLKDRVKVADVLNYTIENFVNKEWRTHIIATKKIPEKKKFGGDQAEVREIDINAPTVYGNSSGGIMRLTNSKMVTDSQRHNNDTLNRVCFSPEVKKLFTLDSAAGSISMYNINGGLEKKISPKGSNKEEIIILDFVWSHKQNRIGACLKDFALIFWDFSDNFEFEMNVPIRKWVSEYQTNIWYLDFLNVWVTTDKSHQLNVWNIEKDVKHFNLTSPHTKASIIDIIVIDLLKLVAVSTMDKRVTLWDFKKKAIVLELDLAQFSIHTMAWSNTYQVLVTAGYESTINLWSINPVYLDYTLVGKLEGHTSTITAVSIIENTSMLISVDDLLKIKMWDLRNLKCVQTLELEAKVFVTKIIDMYMFGKLCFISSRINFLEFDTLSMETSNKVQEDRESIWPISVEYNFHSNELAICTRKDLRFIDLGSGRTKKIYEGLLPNEEDDITAFRLIHQDKKFLLGDQRGRLGLYSYATGEKLKGLVSQSEEVNNLKVDVVNKMIVSSSWDNTIFIQKESNLGYELKRTVRNIHHNRETSILEISVYHNIFVTATNSNMLYVWDYEFMKVMGIIELEEDTEPTCVSFINGDSSLVLADSSGKIHLIRFAKEGFSRICFERTGVIKIDDSAQDHELFVNRILIDIDCISQSGQNTHKVRMYASTNKGEVKVYDLSEFVKSDLSQALAQSGPRGNYKSDRIVNEDFITQVKTYRIYTYSLKDTKSSSPELETQSPHTDLLLMENSLIGEFQAHKDSLTTLILMVSPDKKILTSSLDEYVKIWTLNGALVASLNVNHPLPVVWNISSDDSLKNQTKVINALKLIDTITQHSKVKLTHAEKKMYSIERFLKGVVLLENDSDEDYGHRQFRYKKNEAADSPRKQKVLLMKDEYSPRDFQFNRAKEVYQRELQGPTLRQLEIAHKLAAGQKAGEPKKSDLYEEEDHSFKREREYEGTKKLKDGGMVLSKRTKLLEKKLEKISLLPNQPVKKHSIQPKKGGSRKGSSDPKKFQSRILDEIQLNGKVGENHNEEVVTHQGIGKRSMSIQMDGLKDRVKLKPLKIAQKEGMLAAIAKELNPTTKVSFRENEGRKVPLKDEYPSKSSRLIAEKVARYGPSGELGRQDFNIVLSKLDSILKKPQSPSLQLKDFHRVGLVSNRASNLYSGKNASQNGIESDLKSPSQKSNTDNEKKGKLDTGRSGRAPHERMVSFDQFIKKTAQNYFSEASRPKEEEKKTIKLGQSEKNEKELAKVQSSEALKDEEPDFLSPNNAPIDYKKYQRNSGVDFEPLEETFSSMGQFFKKPKKPTMFKRLGSLSPNSKGNKKVLISQKSNKGNAWPLGFE